MPGSGFGEPEDGPFHFRLTIIESEERLSKALDRIAVFNEQFRKCWDNTSDQTNNQNAELMSDSEGLNGEESCHS